MRRQRRHRPPAGRNRVQLGKCDFIRGNPSRLGDAVENAIARRPRRMNRPIRPAQLRRLRQRDQKRRLRQRKFLWLLAEIGERRRADAFEIAAVGRKRQVKRKHLVLAQAALDLDGANDLPELGPERALVARLEQARDLHGQGRAAGDDAAIADELNGRAHHRQRIDAPMLLETPVLVGLQHFDEARIDLVHGCRQPPAALGRRIGPQQTAVAIEHLRRQFDIGETGDRAERPHPPRATCHRGDGHGGKSCENDAVDLHRITSGAISIVPVPVRPKRSGRYMSST